jgi:phospholipase/carboxylesterase
VSDGLKFARRAAKSGKARSIVVFVHGYGADGADLLGLADVLAPHLPDTMFYAPDAPQPCLGNPFGYQWFPVPWMDGSSEAAAAAGLATSSVALNAFLDACLAEAELTDAELALVGFSQGAMMSMHVAPRRARAVAAVVAISGRLLEPAALAGEVKVKPPILLIHGDQDPVVPFASMAATGDVLIANGFKTYSHVMPGTGHGIANDGLSATLAFLLENLPRGEG